MPKEFDPYVEAGKQGPKMDAGKLSYSKITPQALRNIARMYNEPGVNPDLIFIHAIEPLIELARLFTRGCSGRYFPNSWKQVPDAINRYYDSGQRHREAYREGHVYDYDKIEDGIEQKGTGIMSLVASLWAEYCRVYYVLKDLQERNEPLHIYDERYTDKHDDCGCDGNCGDDCKCGGACKDLKPETGSHMHFIDIWLEEHNINDYALRPSGDYPIYENCLMCGSGQGGNRLLDLNGSQFKPSFAICDNCFGYLQNKQIDKAKTRHPADQWLKDHNIDEYKFASIGPFVESYECCICDDGNPCSHWLESEGVDTNGDRGTNAYTICDNCYQYLQSNIL